MGLFDNKDSFKEDILEAKPEEIISERKAIMEDDQPSEVTVISANTKIDGNISTSGHLVLNGDVRGNTVTKGNVILNGKTDGDITCDSLMAEAANTNSDITATSNVVIKGGTTITGNIACKNITVYGTIHGDIVARGSVVLKSSAVVNGNISAGRIGIESGAKLIGSVSVKQ